MKQAVTEDADVNGEINKIVLGNTTLKHRGVVFPLADLCNLYESRLKQFETNSIFIRTGLKNKLLSKITEFKAFDT